MRLLVTGGITGQVVRAMLEQTNEIFEISALGRPTLDLSQPATLAAQIKAIKPDILVNAAAYTQVDKAEQEEDVAMVINGHSAGVLAQVTAELGIPIIQISTDYVFDGMNPRFYNERDAVAPASAYGRSKLAGEKAVIAANPHHTILRTSWVYDAQGKNFLNTMLRLAQTRDEIRVVADQLGAPSYAPDLADGILTVARNLILNPRLEHYGVFHMAGGGETSWAGFAEEIFRISKQSGGVSAHIIKISSAEYPTLARRPANSRLNCDKIAAVHGVRISDWRDGLMRCMASHNILKNPKKD